MVTVVPNSDTPSPSTSVSIGSMACTAPAARPASSISTAAIAKRSGLASRGEPLRIVRAHSPRSPSTGRRIAKDTPTHGAS